MKIEVFEESGSAAKEYITIIKAANENQMKNEGSEPMAKDEQTLQIQLPAYVKITIITWASRSAVFIHSLTVRALVSRSSNCVHSRSYCRSEICHDSYASWEGKNPTSMLRKEEASA
ncbi:unnamed protein product [Amoebophrya sp. A120]|nr:unnamed protein product [Amoebophrya sp. A120]|eukprot:GSA120T00019549001.1